MICSFSEGVSENTHTHTHTCLVSRIVKDSVVFSLSKHLSSFKVRTQRPTSKDAAPGRAIKVK